VKVDHALDSVAGLSEAVVHQDRHGSVVGGVGQPSVNLGGGKVSQGGREQEAGQQVLPGRVEVSVGLGSRPARAGGEVVSEAGCPDFVGDVGQRVPP
jgi:hypothetical protein